MAIEKIYGIVKEFRCDPRSLPPSANSRKRSAAGGSEATVKRLRPVPSLTEENDEMDVKIFDDEDDLDDLC